MKIVLSQWCLGILLTTFYARGQIVYETSFDSPESYDSNRVLGGQLGWETDGLAPESVGITESGQMYMGGLIEAVPGNRSVSNRKARLDRFVPFNPALSVSGKLQFKTTLTIHHDNPGAADAFYSPFSNQDGFPLFSIFFLTPQRTIAFNNGLFVLEVSPAKYNPDKEFLLEATLDFETDRWSATLDGDTIAEGQPLTVSAPAKNLGSFNLVWQSDRLGDLDRPRDHILLDDLLFTAGETVPRLPIQSLVPSDNNLRMVFGSEPGTRYSIDSSTDLQVWATVSTVTGASAPNDSTAIDLGIDNRPTLFYRIVESPQ